MKKNRFICLFLCFLMALQCAMLPVFAVDTESETETVAETTVPTEATVPPAPVNPYIVPQDITGDASVSHGCVSIDGKKPLTSQSGLLRTANGVILYEMNTGTLVYAKNPDERMYPASLTKVMTCLLALERGNLDEIVHVSESAIADIPWDATSVDLVAGEEMSMRNLLYCLMVESANDAAGVIAEHISGSQEAFCELMNQKAAELGCTGSHFVNPHGLHDDDHYTTPRDMAKIMLAALSYSEFDKLYSTSYYEVPETNLSSSRDLYTTNFLIGNELIDYYYDERFVGGKTGFTTPAGRCIVGTCEEEGSDYRFLTVILGAQETVAEDGVTILYYGNFEESWALADYGFEEFSKVEVCFPEQVMGQFPVTDGENKVAGGPSAACSTILPSDYKKAEMSFTTQLVEGGLTAPVNLGDRIGTLRMWYQDICIGQMDLVSLSNSRKAAMTSGLSGGVITEEENRKIVGSLQTGIKIFIIVAAVVVILCIIVAVNNAIVERKRRKRRRNRRRNR